jgi:hypothetical protein
MPKQSGIKIVNAKNGYRVRFVGANGEVLSTSEELESVAAVHKNIVATLFCGTGFKPSPMKIIYQNRLIEDRTQSQAFVRHGATSGLKVKPKPKAKK